MLGSPILSLKGMRILMFQLSGIYYNVHELVDNGDGEGKEVFRHLFRRHRAGHPIIP